MKFLPFTRMALLTIASTLMFTSCDWESGTKANSTGSGKVGEFDLSNVYRGILDGSMRAVSNPSAGRITFLNLQQTGRSVEIFDSQGSRYTGFVGNGVTQRTNTTPPDTGGSDTGDDTGGGSTTNAISSGRNVTTYPLGFSGFDRVANKNVEFTGVVEVVTQSEFLGGVVTSEGGTVTDVTYVERVLTSFYIKGTWIEANGRISNVLAQVDISDNRLDEAPQQPITPTPATP